MATRLDDLFKQYNDAVSAAGQQYNDAMAAANQSYDTLMRQLDADDAAVYDRARQQYNANANRANWQHNAQLLGDLAHLGVQTWATAPGAMGSAGSNAVIPAIKPTDKYLERGEAWRQKMNQSYLDEVAARTKRKREDALRRLNSDMDAAKTGYNIALKKEEADATRAYRNAQVAETERHNKELEDIARIRADYYGSSVENQNRNRTAKTNQGASGGSTRGKTAQQISDDDVRKAYAELPDDKKAKKTETYKDEYGITRTREVIDESPSLETKRQIVANEMQRNSRNNTMPGVGGSQGSSTTMPGVKPSK